MDVPLFNPEAHPGQPRSPRGRDRAKSVPPPPLVLAPLRAGLRVAVAVSGGADSVALLRALAGEQARLGILLAVAHMHHGIRGPEADADAAFVSSLAETLGLQIVRRDVDTPGAARAESTGLEEAARKLRYGWFAELLMTGADGTGRFDAIATAHTLNDQAETVTHKLLRGAWTEGLGGIHPVLAIGPHASAPLGPGKPAHAPGSVETGVIVRPLLQATRSEITSWLEALGQPWREDSSNLNLAFTRNRIRHQLLPELATYNPRIVSQLGRLAAIARDEDGYWQREVARLLPALLLPGRPVRGGGRASSTLPGEREVAIEVGRLRELDPALVRRLLREAAHSLGAALDFEQTERLLAMAGTRGVTTATRAELTGELRAERTPRELRLVFCAGAKRSPMPTAAAIEIPVPGEGTAYGWRLRCSPVKAAGTPQPPATLRAATPADRVQLRYSRGAPKRVKEVLDRLGIPSADRAGWPVLVWRGEIVWLRGVQLEPTLLSAQLDVEAEAIVQD